MTDMIESSKCVSCGGEKEYPQHGLCYFCYMRGRTNTLKFSILGILLNSSLVGSTPIIYETSTSSALTDIDRIVEKYKIKEVGTKKRKKRKNHLKGKKFSVEEIVDRLNKMHPTKTKFNPRSVKTYLIKYTKYKAISASKVRTNKVGRPRIVYKITVRGMELFLRLYEKWKAGKILLIRKRHKKLKIKTDWDNRASEIRGRMRNPSYDSLIYMFPQRQVNASASTTFT